MIPQKKHEIGNIGPILIEAAPRIHINLIEKFLAQHGSLIERKSSFIIKRMLTINFHEIHQDKTLSF